MIENADEQQKMEFSDGELSASNAVLHIDSEIQASAEMDNVQSAIIETSQVLNFLPREIFHEFQIIFQFFSV